MTPFSLRNLFWICLKVGNLTFGGGDPTMAALHHEFVDSRAWLNGERYGLLFALARITPGTNILAFVAGAGWDLARLAGAVAAVVATAAPGGFLVVWFTVAYENWKSNPLAMAAIGGTLAAAIGMMGGAAIQLLRPHWNRGRWRALTLASAALILSAAFHWTPVQILALAAAAGYLWRPPAA